MIDKDTIQKIVDTANILEVVQDFVTLKRRGTNYIGLCPFHNEKTPSFNVSPARGIYKCFGCSKGGNSVNFIMDHEHLSYPDALRYLARKYHISITERELSPEEKQSQTERESLLIINAFAQKYFSNNLLNTPEGEAVGMSYFKERGFRHDTIEKFQLGYCLEKGYHFTNEALKKGFKLEFLQKLGLTKSKETMNYDFYRGRVMFPIHSLSGRVIGFAGRVLKKAENMAKYVNSSDSEIYHKNEHLYGMYFAKRSIVQSDKCFLVEGYTDVISMHQSGIENVVASSGTSLTINQIRLIHRFTNQLTMLYDGDAAGIKASVRGIELILQEGMNVKVILLPDGEDPDSYAQKHSSTEVLQYIAGNESDFITFKAKLLSKEAQNDPIKKAGLINEIVNTIAILPDAITRSVYAKECSKILQVDEKVIYAELQRRLAKQTSSTPTPQPPQNLQPPIEPPPDLEPMSQIPDIDPIVLKIEMEIIRVMLNYGNSSFLVKDKEYVTVADYIIKQIEDDFDNLQISTPMYQLIFQEYSQKLKLGEAIDGDFFVKHQNLEINQLAASLLSPAYRLSNFWNRSSSPLNLKEVEFKEAIPKLMMVYKERKIRLLLKEVEMAIKNTTEVETQQNLMQKYILLKQMSMLFAKEIGEIIIQF